MTLRRQDSAHDHEIDLAAAEWLIKRDRGFTAKEQDDFSHWLSLNPKHGHWLARHQETWNQFNLLGEWRPEHSLEPNPDLLARPRQVRRWLQPIAWAAAAGLLLAFMLAQTRHGGQADPKSSGIPPIRVAAAQAYERRVLEDGSIIELNRGAAVEVLYTATERRVELSQGEAYFTVAKNPARPFMVHAGSVRVRAVGTAFNVRYETTQVEVLVTEGRVEVKPAASPWAGPENSAGQPPPQLIAGQLALVSLAPTAGAPEIQAVTPQAMARLLAWQPQMLDFNSTPLAEVVAEFNRRNHTQLLLADPTLGEIPIVASFRSDNIDAFVRLLEITAGVQTERKGQDVIVLRPAVIPR